MRWIRNFAVILILMWVVGSCLKAPENSIIPQIQIKSITFKREFPAAADTLVVKLTFQDGDGDLGVNENETAIYTSQSDSTDIRTPFYYVYDSTATLCGGFICTTHVNTYALPKGANYINYKMKRTIPSADTLPSLSCKSWEYGGTPADTLYIQNNPYYDNIFVYLYTKNPDGTYTYFDPATYFAFGTSCITNFFNARFPVLSSDLGKISPLDGTLTYNIQSSALYLHLHGKTVKLKIYILDRAFHQSNIVESDDFIIN